MRLLLYEKMVRIKRDAEWSVALGKAVERLDLGVGFKNSDLDNGTEFIVCYPLQGNVKQLVNWNTVHGHWESKGEPATGIMHQGCLWIPIPDMQASLSATEKG
jgi:hypothetical protein